MSVVDPLPAGAFTLTGKTTGPAVNLGRNRYSKSQMMYFHLDEIRDAAVKAGWHTEQDYQQLLAERDALLERAREAAEVLVDQNEKIDGLEKAGVLEAALGFKPEAPKAAPAPKTKRQP